MSQTDQIRRLRFARLLWQQAHDHARVDQDARNAACIMSLQDAVETVLLVVAEAVDATVPRAAEFDKYFASINAKIAPKSLPLHSALTRLNRMRVQAKHAGIFPSHDQAIGMIPVVDAFLTEVCLIYLERDWRNADLSALVTNDLQRYFLGEAERALVDQRFQDALVSARKAFFLAFEEAYDVRGFETVTPAPGLLGLFACAAPAWAKSADYVRQYVGDPFQYIVIDNMDLESRLVKMGADPVAFWNVWRITPAVYRFPDGSWVTKRELSKTERADLEADCVYVVETVGELLLRKETQERRMRTTPPSGSWQLPVKAGAVLRSRAALDAPVSRVFQAPATVQVNAGTCGLDGQGSWWDVHWFGPDGFGKGYLLEDDVDRAPG